MTHLPSTSGGPPPFPPLPPADLRDPRIRYTFADVAMKLAHDGPWYFVLAVVMVLTLRGVTNAVESLNGLALVLLARNRPPEQPDKAHLIRNIATGAGVLVVFGAIHAVVTLKP